MKYLTPFLLFLLLLSCGKKDPIPDDFRNYKLKIETKKHESSEMKYSMLVPANYAGMLDDNEDEVDVESFADTNFVSIGSDTNFCILQVIKFKFDAPGIEAVHDTIIHNFKNRTDLIGLKLIESGKTDFLQYESYVVHFKSDHGTPGEVEGYSFLVKAREDKTYYSLDVSVPQYDKKSLRENLGMLLSCLRSFEMK